MCFLFLLLFYIIKIKCFFFIFIFGCKFEVWRKKTHLIIFQVGFFFIIINFIYFNFLLFIWFLHFCNIFSFKIILLYFRFLVSFVSIPFV
jgi:hypothetical protein